MNVVDELKRAKIREQCERWDQGEAAIAAELKLDEPKPLAPDVLERLSGFSSWCATKSVRKCQARPKTVAAYVLHQGQLGIPAQQIISQLAALESLHDFHSLPNPIRTAPVRAALETIVRVDPPRSWPAEDKARFAMLDPADRHVIAAREREREVALRRSQNKYAEAIKDLKRQSSAAETATNEVIENDTST